jgi:signal transduction histidine kinase
MHTPRIPSRAAGTEFDANDLLAVVSQDLLVPLTSMTLMATRIKNTVTRAGADPALRVYMDRLLESAADMEQLIRDLQVGTFAEVTDVATLSCHDVAGLIARAMEMLLPRLDAAGIALDFAVSGRILAACHAPRLFEAFAHLIDHAIALAPPGGALRISAAKDQQECLVGIVASGDGIPEAEFVAVGPYIARAIVEAHGGRMWVDSDPGVRSGFYFALPID